MSDVRMRLMNLCLLPLALGLYLPSCAVPYPSGTDT